MTKTEQLLVKNIESMTKTSLLLLVDTIYNNQTYDFWSYDFELPSYFKDLFEKSKKYTLDLPDILSTDVETKETILNDIREYIGQHAFEIFKLTMYRNYVNILSLKLSNMNHFSLNKDLKIDLNLIEDKIANYIKNIKSSNDISDLLTYFSVLDDEKIIDTDIRKILNNDFAKLEEIEARLAYINFKNYVMPNTFQEFGLDFPEIHKDIVKIENLLKGEIKEEDLTKLRKELGEIESTIINIIADLNIVYENFNSLIILITNIENFDYLFENDLVLRDLYHTFVAIVTGKESNTAIVEQFEERLNADLETRIDEVQSLSKQTSQLESFADREQLIYEGYTILHSLFYGDIETSFTTTTYLLNHYNSKFFENNNITKTEIVNILIDDLLKEFTKDDFTKKALFSQLFRIVNYPYPADTLIKTFVDYFKNIDDYKKVQYENLLFFFNSANKN